MAKNPKKRKIRTDFRKNREVRVREQDLTRGFEEHGFEQDESGASSERISGRSDLARRRTVIGAKAVEDDAGLAVLLDVDESICRPGRVLNVSGLHSTVEAEGGELIQCATRRLLKSLSTDQRHVVAAGDRVQYRPSSAGQGIIERVEPRRGVISRTSRHRQHIIVTNVDQLLIVGSAAEPRLKPNLLDRFLVTAEKSQIEPIVCINKIDLVDPAELQPLAGVFGQMGYRVLLVSAETGEGIDELRRILAGHSSAVAGQSGVGKSTLLNVMEPGLSLRVQSVSSENQKGRHTTTSARLFPLSFGGYVIDTPGIRQFQLWDVIPEEVCGFFRDLRPFVSLCKYPNCTHTHEADCAIKNAVAAGRLDVRRYESYCQMYAGDMV